MIASICRSAIGYNVANWFIIFAWHLIPLFKCLAVLTAENSPAYPALHLFVFQCDLGRYGLIVILSLFFDTAPACLDRNV